MKQFIKNLINGKESSKDKFGTLREKHREIIEEYNKDHIGNYFYPTEESWDYNYFCNKGKQLAQNGVMCIRKALELYEKDFGNKKDNFEREFFQSEDITKLQNREKKERQYLDVEHFLTELSRLKRIKKNTKEESLNISPYNKMYPSIISFPELTESAQDYGEMFFHQLRLLNMCHLGKSDEFHLSRLNKILRDIPDKTFLGESRLNEFGNKYVLEVLKRGYAMNDLKKWVGEENTPITEAESAIEIYNVSDEKLLGLVEGFKKMESSYQNKMRDLFNSEETLDKDYRGKRNDLLKRVN